MRDGSQSRDHQTNRTRVLPPCEELMRIIDANATIRSRFSSIVLPGWTSPV